MKKAWLYIFFMICSVPALLSLRNAEANDRQSKSGGGFRLLKSISIEAKDIQTDRLGNLYVVTKTNQLYKYDMNGELRSTLNYKYLGNITDIDASNPLEVYVFYKELNEVLFLDNNLAYRGELLLNDYGIAQAAAVARSYDNGVWVFDNGDLQLKRISKAGELLQQSGNVRQFVSGMVSPGYIYDNNDRVFVNDSSIGIMVFNVFANYIKTIPIKGCDSFKIIENEIFYNKDGKLFRYNTGTFQESIFQMPDTTYTREISIEKERLYLLKSGSVEIYAY
jgi:hypothetical protein